MKNLNQKQIEQVKSIKPWTNTYFHGNRKFVNGLTVDQVREIVSKKQSREIAKQPTTPVNIYERLRGLLSQSKGAVGTNYFKILIEGATGIYYASPIYQHSDYNKTRVFDKTAETLKLMKLFNAICYRISLGDLTPEQVAKFDSEFNQWAEKHLED